MKDSRHIIWTDYLDYDDWKEDLEAQYPELSANERMNLMYEINGTYFQDEKTNLDIQLSRPILVVGDLGLWHGRRMGYKEIESGNISDCLYTERDIDNATWFVDKNGDFRCEAIHHDGTNHYLYRAYKDGVSETQIDNLKEKIYRGMITAIFGYLLVLLSAGVPARAASKISIIGNLKGEKGVMKVKCSNFTSSAENLLAKRTIKREKKAFRAITFSLAISIFLFVSANAFSLYMLSFVEAERKNIGYDLRMNYSMEFGTKEFDELYSFVKSQDGIDEVGWFAESPSHFHSVLLDSEWITDSYRGSDWATLKESSELYKAPFYIFIISNERYSEFLSQNGLKNDNSVYASAFYDEIDEDSKSTSFPILKDGSYHADVRYMSEAASERLSQDINANPNDRFDYENYYDTFFSVNFTVGNYDFPLEFRPNYGGISILIPESRMPEFNAEITSKEIMIQSPNYANIQKNTTDYLTSVGLAEDVSIFSSAESYESQRNFAAMIKLFSTSFLILLTVISCANVFNVITTSLNMRKREFAVLRSVGMTVNKLFAMLCIENLRNGLLAILIGGISSLPLCYLIYKSIVVGAVIDFVFPLGAFVISSLAMFLIMFLTSLYGLWKIKNGDIIADVRNDFV